MFYLFFFLKILKVEGLSATNEVPGIFDNVNENLVAKTSVSKKIMDVFKKGNIC